MTEVREFIDTNVLFYLLSSDVEKSDRTEEIIRNGGLISVQVLNEVTNVALRKFSMSWREIGELISLIQSVCRVESLSIATHDKGRSIAERYKINIYDAMIVSSALIAGCNTLYSEDMQNGMLIEDKLYICNPFL